MAEGSDISFARLVINRAWFSAWAFFESKVRDAILFAVLFATGGGAYYRLYGWPAAKEQIVPVIIFTVGPMVALWMVLFIWYLWLAPSALAYEAAMARPSTSSSNVPPPVLEKQINWAVWKQRSAYSLIEFSSILAKELPTGSTEEASSAAFLKLLQEDAMNRRLPIVKDRNAESYFQPDTWPAYFSVKRADALSWANDKGFDVTHVS